MDMEHERRLTEVEDMAKTNQRRIEKLEKRQDNLDQLVGTVKVLVEKEERVETDVKEIKKDVKSLTDKPGQRWDALITQIVAVLVAAVVGFLLARVGLG